MRGAVAIAAQYLHWLLQLVLDEARHSRFGWEAVEELLERTGEAGRQLLQARLPGYLARVREDYRSRAAPCTPQEERWGR